jgi:hypothetical protein
MRKILLLMALVAISLSSAYAQCTPNPLFVATGIPGIWPNPAMGALPDGQINTPYGQTLTIIVLEDTTIDLSAATGFPGLPTVNVSVNYQNITAINGLPPGMSFTCSPSNCQWAGGDSGCVRLAGTPTQGGSYVVDVVTGFNFDVPSGVPIIGGQNLTLPLPGVSYDLFVDDPNSIEELMDDRFSVAQNAPNPFTGVTEILYNTPAPTAISLEVFDLTGMRVHKAEMRSDAGRNSYRLDATTWTPGVYFYTLTDGESTSTHKLVVME